MSGDLERRYRRVLRLLPGYYRRQWEEDMVAAFLDSALTGDPDEDEFITEYGRPDWPEVASVACLAARLYLGGAGTPRRYFAWGQAVRGTVLAVTLAHAVRGLGQLVLLGGSRYQIGWLLPQPAAARHLAHGVIPDRLHLGGGLPGAGPGVLPRRPGHRGAGHRRRPGRRAAGAAHRRPAAVRVVAVLDPARPGPGAGHGRVPPRTLRRPRGAHGCWHCPRATCWCPCRCWPPR